MSKCALDFLSMPGWPDENGSKSEKKIQKSENDQKIFTSNQKKIRKRLCKRQVDKGFVHHIIYALISFGLLANDKQTNNKNI